MLADQFQAAFLVGQLDLDPFHLAPGRPAPGLEFVNLHRGDAGGLVAGQPRQIHMGRAILLGREVIHEVGETHQGDFVKHPLGGDIQRRRARRHRRLDRRLHARPVEYPAGSRSRRITSPDRGLRGVKVDQILANE